MFLINDDSNFKLLHNPNAKAGPEDFLFIYNGNNIGLTLENQIPMFESFAHIIEEKLLYCFGRIHHQQCLLWNTVDPGKLNFNDTRLTYKLLSKDLYQAVAIGNHIHHWQTSHRYCGRCAAPMLDVAHEQARICSKCHAVIYPKISPCIIVLITRGEEMLLARSPHFPPEMMSTLAGFITIGESVEQSLIREVQEEVGIQIGNLKYICSQPWPFPDSLMLGFTAEYVSGEIAIDNNEIETAGWFTNHNLPLLPNEMSIARYLIEQHLSK